MAVVHRHHSGRERALNGVITSVAQRMARIRGKPQVQAVVPITGAVAGVGNRVRNKRKVSDNGDNHNHIEEVIHGNNNHPAFPALTGRLEQLAYRQ